MNKYYLVINSNSNSPIYGLYLNYEDAVKEAINIFIDLNFGNCNDDFFKLKSFNEILKYIQTEHIQILVKIIEDNGFDFNFDNVLQINQYNYVNNLLITDIGVFKISKEDFEKFEKMFIFK